MNGSGKGYPRKRLKFGWAKLCSSLATAFNDSSATFQAGDKAGVNGESGVGANFSWLRAPAVAGRGTADVVGRDDGVEDPDRDIDKAGAGASKSLSVLN